jgi:oxygen-independent coproporphyrinogen-3 oxidase
MVQNRNMLAARSASATAAAFDPDVLARHDVTGPRYTSYPTAPQLRTDVTEADLRRAAEASNAGMPAALSIYVHVPFCFSPCFYCGCTRIITRDRTRADRYLDHLAVEIGRLAPLFDPRREVVQLHLGGGTPNFLDDRQMERLVGTLAGHFRFAATDHREFGIELDPRHADAAQIARLAALGFGRLSIGVQDFDPDVQAALNRAQTPAQVGALLAAAAAEGFRSVNLDLIYGLPRQTPQRFARTLDQVVALRPQRVVTYAYAHLPERFRAQRQIRADELPDAATRLALLGLAIERLTAAGYRYIGMDHFALPDDDLAIARDEGTLHRNFQGYSTHARTDLIGLGVSAIGRIGDCHVQNRRDLPGYGAALDAGALPVERGLHASRDDRIRADVIQQLMCRDAIDVRATEERHDIVFADYFADVIDRLRAFASDGLVGLSPDRIRVLPRGRLLVRNVAMCFDAYLHRADAVPVRYSKAV